MVPTLWPRRWIVQAGVCSALGAAAIALGWIAVEANFPDNYRPWLGLQLALFILGGISALWLALTDFWHRRDSDSALLLFWVIGTFLFAGFVNWTINARSVLPMIPAVGLLITSS
jgi:hypothetical protein